MQFPEEILDVVHALRKKYTSKKHCVVLAFPILEIIKVEKNGDQDREISTKFFYNYISNTFEMQAPDCRYYSRISHYDFNRVERRWTRNKNYIFSLIRDLKICGLWNYISNKDIIVINSFNKNSDQVELLAMLEELTRGERGTNFGL